MSARTAAATSSLPFSSAIASACVTRDALHPALHTQEAARVRQLERQNDLLRR
jgi:hypothetical protein